MSKRIAILQAIDDAVAEITAANGYNLTLASHTYGYVDYTQVNSFPAVCMIPGDSPYVPLTNTEYTSGSSRGGEAGWLISVIGYVHVPTAEDKQMTEQMEYLIEDLVKAVLADHRLGLSYVAGIYLASISRYIDFEQAVGIVQLIFSVKYDFEASSP